jgi:hypothetical protein
MLEVGLVVGSGVPSAVEWVVGRAEASVGTWAERWAVEWVEELATTLATG